MRFVVLVPGDVHLLVRADRVTLAVDESHHVPAVLDAVRGGVEHRVPEAEPDAEARRFGVERLRRFVRHLGLVPVVGGGDVGHVPAGEERGERQLGVDDQVAADVTRLPEQVDQPFDHVGTGVIALDRAELATRDSDRSRHGAILPWTRATGDT